MTQATHPVMPWWRVGIVWLVLAGPAAVVLAGIATTVIAVSGADAQVQPHAASVSSVSDVPAVQGRNHAATAK